jgi:4-hydroxysphinganine ceramide fatty acyl 2-hydroxylase
VGSLEFIRANMTNQGNTQTVTLTKQDTSKTPSSKIPLVGQHADRPALRGYTMAELREKYSTPDALYVAYQGRVFDVTSFAADHPGGVELVLTFGGEDITRVMSDPDTHIHSETAYAMLEEHCVGWLEDEQKTDTVTSTASSTTDHSSAPAKSTTSRPNTIAADDDFLSFNEPLVYQMWTSKFSKEFYLKQVHKPRYLPHPARLFASPILEALSRTAWWVIPLFWTPVIVTMCSWALPELGVATTATAFIIGTATWSLVEYILHRFIFHMETLLPERSWALTLHFLGHGIHHFLPMDRLRLVMPPAAATIIATPLYYGLSYPVVVHGLGLTDAHNFAFFAGIILGYICYDLMHYYLHHGAPIGSHIREMKTYHLAHHYKEANLGFGVSSKTWDYVFGTVLRV